MCNQFTFHQQFRIDAGRSQFEQQTDSIFLLVDPMDRNQKDLDTIDLEAPRLEPYMHKAWKRHQDAVYWVDIDLAICKGLTFYRTRSNAIILQGTLPAYCIPKVVRMETGEVTSVSAKDLIETRMKVKIGFRSCSITRERSWSTSKKFQIKPTKSEPRS